MKITDSINLIKTLEAAGAAHKMVICKDGGHGLNPKENYGAEFARDVEWLERHTIGRKE